LTEGRNRLVCKGKDDSGYKRLDTFLGKRKVVCVNAQRPSQKMKA